MRNISLHTPKILRLNKGVQKSLKISFLKQDNISKEFVSDWVRIDEFDKLL